MRLSLQLPYYTGMSNADQTVELSAQPSCEAVGIEIQTRKFAPAVFFAPYQNGGIVYGGNWDMTVLVAGRPSATSRNVGNAIRFRLTVRTYSHFCNAELDSLSEQFKNTYDESKHRGSSIARYDHRG